MVVSEWLYGGEDFWVFMDVLLMIDEFVVLLLCVDLFDVEGGRKFGLDYVCD